MEVLPIPGQIVDIGWSGIKLRINDLDILIERTKRGIIFSIFETRFYIHGDEFTTLLFAIKHNQRSVLLLTKLFTVMKFETRNFYLGQILRRADWIHPIRFGTKAAFYSLIRQEWKQAKRRYDNVKEILDELETTFKHDKIISFWIGKLKELELRFDAAKIAEAIKA